MPESVTIRPFAEEDLPQVLDVMRAALGEPPGLARTPELFAWKHFSNPFGRSIILVAEEGGRLAGVRAFMRWNLQAPGGLELRCVRAVDTATHPDFQRRGIFRSLTMAGLEAASEAGIDLVFNTPNKKSGPGYLTMGWQRVQSIGVMVRPLPRLLWSWRSRASAGISQASPDPGTTGVGVGLLDDLSDRAPVGLRTPRTADYLRWRFLSHPSSRYLLVGDAAGWAVGRPHQRNGRDELVLSELGGLRAPRAVGELSRLVKPHYLVGWFSPGTVERTLAWRAGLVAVPGVSALTLMVRPLRDLPIDVTLASSWDLSLGDLELL